ncbi:MAG TPA: hypothetical protein PK874_01820 [Desulfobacteraceae bacterium]|nr:hypothetical protein [Desulfobacteraceae bacterium]HPQ27930.1 hypothetical protein [Desulfobacteraceae bacterium]
MRWIRFFFLVFIIGTLALSGTCFSAADRTASKTADLFITYPMDKTLFPGNIIPPTVRWKDRSDSHEWRIEIRGGNGQIILSALTADSQWRPSVEEWDRIKKSYRDEPLTLSICGFPTFSSSTPLSKDMVNFSISSLTITAPIFYRQVPIPARYARSHLPAIEWRLGSVASPQPRTILSGMKACGNCHSFSSNGRILGMDVDFGSDKGAYVITEINTTALFNKSEVMTWSDYDKESKHPTFGLLSRLSPDGRYAVSTVNDYAAYRYLDDLDCSQMFFPVRGILVIYDRETKSFHELAGASDPNYVQTNPAFSPDGRWIVFPRAPALENAALRAMMNKFMSGTATYRYDLYRVPFQADGTVTPEPVSGASNNGMSNFFPAFSPDGKWIVFCMADRFMLNQMDSELYIIPANGGTARRLACNIPGRMNSWHSWSPDGKWLAFASKANGPYTQVWLTHINAEGESTPAVLLDHFTDEELAANIPEFINISFEDQLLRIVNQLD